MNSLKVVDRRGRLRRLLIGVFLLLSPLCYELALAAWGASYLSYDGSVLSGSALTQPTSEPGYTDSSCYQQSGEWICYFWTYDGVEVDFEVYGPIGLYFSESYYGYSVAYLSMPSLPNPYPGSWHAYGDHYIRWDIQVMLCPSSNVQPWQCIQNLGNYSELEHIGSSWDSVNVSPPPPPPPPPVCEDPGYTPPPLQSLPSPKLVQSLGYSGGGQLMLGDTYPEVQAGTLTCVQTCIDGQDVWRLEGDLLLDPFTVEVIHTLPPTMGANGLQCIADTRPQQFIANTTNHENIHAQVFLDAFEPRRDVLGTTYSTESTCLTAASTTFLGADQLMINEIQSENAHPNHPNEQKTAAGCWVLAQTQERWCGNQNGNTPYWPNNSCPSGDNY